MAKGKSETTKKADTKLTVNRNVADGASKKITKEVKAAKDPNMSKMPSSAFFMFMEEFRKYHKEKFPDNKSVAVVGKAGGARWKSMTDFDKAPYVAKAEKRKAELLIYMEAYNNILANRANVAEEEDGSDKSKSEVNDDKESGEVSVPIPAVPITWTPSPEETCCVQTTATFIYFILLAVIVGVWLHLEA